MVAEAWRYKDTQVYCYQLHERFQFIVEIDRGWEISSKYIKHDWKRAVHKIVDLKKQ